MNLYILAGSYKQSVYWCKHALFTDKINPRYISRYEDLMGIKRSSYYVRVGTWENHPDINGLELGIVSRTFIEVDWKQDHWIDKLIEDHHD